MTLSRRFVFKTIFGGTAAVATLAVTQAKQLRAPEQKWDDVVDIIVIGGGAAGRYFRCSSTRLEGDALRKAANGRRFVSFVRRNDRCSWYGRAKERRY